MLMHVDAVRVLVVDREVVEDVAVLGSGADLPAAHADGASTGCVPQRPVDDVEVVDVLLDDVVAGEPGEVDQLRSCHSMSLHAGSRRFFQSAPWFQ